VKCPCLYSTAVPLCRADTEGIFIPGTEHQARFCLHEGHRRCEVFRRYLDILVERPEQWSANRTYQARPPSRQAGTPRALRAKGPSR